METIILKYYGNAKSKQKTIASLTQFMLQQLKDEPNVDWENFMIFKPKNIIEIQLPEPLTDNNMFVLEKLNIYPV